MSELNIISNAELDVWLDANQRWSAQDGALKAEFKFKNFVRAFGFLTQVAIVAEKQNHHPLIENMYNRVTLSLTTHDADNQITERDLKLIKSIERFVNE